MFETLSPRPQEKNETEIVTECPEISVASDSTVATEAYRTHTHQMTTRL